MEIFTWQNFILALGYILAILAWLSKLRWSQEFKDAKEAQLQSKDEIIKSKEEQLKSQQENFKGQLQSKEELLKVKDAEISLMNRENEGLQEILSGKTKEFFKNVKENLEEIIETQKIDITQKESQLKSLQSAFLEKDNQVKALLPEANENKVIIEKLEEERLQLETEISEVKEALKKKQIEVENENIVNEEISISSNNDGINPANNSKYIIKKLANDEARRMLNDPIYKEIQSLRNDPVYKEIQRLHNDPAIIEIQRQENDPAIKEARRIFNDPAIKEARRMLNDPIFKEIQRLKKEHNL